MNWQSPLLALVMVCAAPGVVAQDASGAEFERSSALEISQAAIGAQVGNHQFYDTQGQRRQIAGYAGKPLVVSLIHTSCYHICPATTQHLATVVRKAQDVLGKGSFSVATVGFDVANDTADAMRVFARQQNVEIDGWDFLSTDADTIDGLAAELGFQYFSTGSGFDHLIQSSVIDANGVVVRQVYGIRFDTPHLIEPLKALVFGEDPSASLFDQLTARVKLFCTVYDPASDRYRFDYSIFVGLVMGLVLGGVCIYLFTREWRHSRRHARRGASQSTVSGDAQKL